MSHPTERERAPALLWLAGVVLFAFDAWLVSSPPLDVPYLRELYFVGVASGREALSWDFLHRPTLEHVMPLPMGLGALVVRLSGVAGAGRVLNLALLALSAYWLLRAVALIRGRTTLADATIPLVVLGPAHVFSFVSGFNLQLVASGALFSAAIGAAAVCATRFRRRWFWAGLAALVALPLCGVSGVLSLAFAWPAMAWVAVRNERSLGAGAALATSAALGLRYFPWSRLSESHEHAVSPLRLSAELLPAALGAAGSRAFPWTLLLVAALVLAALWVLAKSERRAVFTVIALGLTGQLVIALAIGFGRSQYDNALTFTERYVELAVPWLLFAHLGLAAAEGAGRLVAARLSAGLALVAAVAAADNAPHAVARVREAEAGLRAFSGDARAGLSLSALAERHGTFLYPFDRGALLAGLSTMMLEPLPPFDRSPTGGLLSLESHAGACASDLVSWAKPRAPGSPERALDDHVPSEWQAPEGEDGVFDLALSEPRSLSIVCLLSGQKRGADSRVRVEAWASGKLVASAPAELHDFVAVPLLAPRFDQLKVYVSPGASLAELALAP